jgi:DNA mismatch repair protein MutL
LGNIVLLDELTINKIAAGEVIERPASVVKELVENSIDAGADKITIEVQNGGISKIRIIDNGCGLKQDDLDFAFERHATSKIRKADDLENVKSMGFRGEALASIAAIANVEMITKTTDSEIGNKIIVEGGKILEKEECGAQNGTTITVNNLFFNTPVRYKFLKKDFTELGYIEDIVTKIALANPNIAIKLLNSNKEIISTTGDGNLKNTVYSIYGKEISQSLLNVDYTYEDIKVCGVIGKPEIARSNRANQIFFVNKRFIKDKTLSAATEQAFKGLLTIGKYGFLILNIEIDPKKIDVNVHPTKLQIRWQEESTVFKAVYHSIKESLLKGDLIQNPEKKEEVKIESTLQPEQNEVKDENTNKSEERIEKFNKEMQNDIQEKSHGFMGLFRKNDNKENKNEETQEIQNNTIKDLYNKKNGIEDFKIPTEEQIDKMTDVLNMQKNMEEKIDKINNVPKEFDEMYVKTFGQMPAEKKEQIDENIDAKTILKPENVSVFENDEKYNYIPNYKYIGALFNTYIVLEMKDEVYIIDQHAAHERIMYEKVKKNFYSDSEKDSQIMLLPDIINLSHKEKDIVKENLDLFKKAGFMLEEFGDSTIRLIGVPSICMELDTKELFLEILDQIDTVAITARQEKEEKFISTVACKAAVKGNMKLTKEEVDSLMEKLLPLPNPFTCPHGRPTAIKMTKYDIERKFSRK